MRSLLALLLIPGLAFAAAGGSQDEERLLGDTSSKAVPAPRPAAPDAPATPSGRASTDSQTSAPPPAVSPQGTLPDSLAAASPVAVRGDTLPSDTLPPPSPAILPLAIPSATPPLAAVPVGPRSNPSVRTIAIGIDTTGRSRVGRSTWTAVGLTMLLPGAGHRYLGHRTGAAVWMTTDLVSWSALLVATRMGTLYLEDATEIANRHAGANLDADADPAFLEVMRDWRSRRPVEGRRDSYDEALLQQGLATDSRFPNDEAHDWDWGSPENPENNRNIARFEDALKGYRTSRVVLSYAAGALLLSRAVAVADILRIRRKSASRAGLQAVVVPGPDGGSAVVSLRF